MIKAALAKARNRAGVITTRLEKTHTYDVIETTLVVHEWLMDELRVNARGESTNYVRQVIGDISNNYGSSAMRSIALQAGVIVEKCWDHMHVDNPDYFDGDSWDWEFVPWVCRNLPWDQIAKDNQYGNADWLPDIAEFMAKLEAAKALGVD